MVILPEIQVSTLYISVPEAQNKPELQRVLFPLLRREALDDLPIITQITVFKKMGESVPEQEAFVKSVVEGGMNSIPPSWASIVIKLVANPDFEFYPQSRRRVGLRSVGKIVQLNQQAGRVQTENLLNSLLQLAQPD